MFFSWILAPFSISILTVSVCPFFEASRSSAFSSLLGAALRPPPTLSPPPTAAPLVRPPAVELWVLMPKAVVALDPKALGPALLPNALLLEAPKAAAVALPPNEKPTPPGLSERVALVAAAGVLAKLKLPAGAKLKLVAWGGAKAKGAAEGLPTLFVAPKPECLQCPVR